MALKDYSAPSEVIKFPGGEFTVRGLSLEDVTALVSNFKEAVVTAYDTAKAGTAVNVLLMDTLTKSPDFVAALIANAADEPDHAANVKKLPVPLQVEALIVIGRLTFGDLAGAVKFVGTLADTSEIVNTLAKMLPQVQTSTTG